MVRVWTNDSNGITPAMRMPDSGSVMKTLVAFPSEKPIETVSTLVVTNVYWMERQARQSVGHPSSRTGMRTSGSPLK